MINSLKLKEVAQALAFSLVLSVASAQAENWPAFRGENASGVSQSAKIPESFGPNENVVWSANVPWAPSSPCVWGDKIFLTAFANGKLETRAYARDDGKLLWSQAAPSENIEEFHSTEGSPAASTPVTDGQCVVSYFGSAGVFCYDFQGKELWRVSLPTILSSGSFGTGSSPLIAHGMVLVPRDQVGVSTLLGIDLKTGGKRWEEPRPDVMPGFGSPIIWKTGGTEELIMPSSLKLKAYDLQTGKERWSLAGMPSLVCTTPVTGAGLLFFAGWAPGKEPGTMFSFQYLAEKFDKNQDGAISQEEMKGTEMEAFFRSLDMNHDGKITKEDIEGMAAIMAKGENVLIAVKPGGHGELTESSIAWKQSRGLPYVSSPLFYEGRVYLVKDGGMVSCFEAESGKIIYQQERLKDAAGTYYASPVAAAGRIIFASADGKVSVVKAGGEQPEILHQANFKERIFATPALVGNRIYLRTASKLYALGK